MNTVDFAEVLQAAFNRNVAQKLSWNVSRNVFRLDTGTRLAQDLRQFSRLVQHGYFVSATDRTTADEYPWYLKQIFWP